MNLWQNYVRAASVSDALQALRSAPGPAFPIAGGTDLLIDLEQGRHSPAHTLVDVTSVVEMTTIEARGDRLFIGAAAPLARIAGDSLVKQHAFALVEACELVGGPQVRNVATLGGNVAHALPAADGTIALLALDARAELASLDGSRQIPMAELFLGPGKSAVRRLEELIVGFYLPLRLSGAASCFKRIMRPQGVALPILNLAVWLRRQEEVISHARISVGPGAPTPWRALAAEQELIGKPLSQSASREALEALLARVGFRSSARRASADYRRHLVDTLFVETLTAAWERALARDDSNGFTRT